MSGLDDILGGLMGGKGGSGGSGGLDDMLGGLLGGRGAGGGGAHSCRCSPDCWRAEGSPRSWAA